MKITLGAMAPDLSEQLADSAIQKQDLVLFDRDAQAIDRLYARGYLTDSQVDSARLKLVEQIQKAAKASTGASSGSATSGSRWKTVLAIRSLGHILWS